MEFVPPAPPQDLDSERMLLGSCMQGGPVVMDDVVPIVSADMFYLSEHRNIWLAISELHKLGEPIALFPTEKQLKLLKLHGPDREYLIEVTEHCDGQGNALYYADVISVHYRRRLLIALGSRLTNVSYSLTISPEETAASFMSQLESIVTPANAESCNAIDLLRQLPEHLAGQAKSTVATGLEHLDKNFADCSVVA